MARNAKAGSQASPLRCKPLIRPAQMIRLFAKCPFKDLPRAADRQFVAKFDMPRIFVCRKLRLTPIDEFGFAEFHPGFSDDKGLYFLTQPFILYADDRT